MAEAPSTVDRIESAANITLTVSKGGSGGDGASQAQMLKVPISSLDRTKDIEISEIRQSSLKANGYSVTAISFSGSMMFAGERVHGPDNEPIRIDELLFDDEDVPNPVSITITHELSGKSETFQDVLTTSDAYEVQSESETETSYDWVAMDKDTNYE
jgi:hypothetical protein